MRILRWNPFRDLPGLEDQVDRFFQTPQNGGTAGSAITNGWMPLTDIHENENDLIVRAELPGVDPKDVDVRIENNVLTIRGERRMEETLQKADPHRLERYYGTFSRVLALPMTVDADKIHAEFKDGVLSVVLPKAEESRSKKIAIDAAA